MLGSNYASASSNRVPIRVEPCGTVGPRAAALSSYDSAGTPSTPEPAMINGTNPRECIRVEQNVG